MAFDRGHALVVGVGSYTHAPQLDVPVTVADAKAVRAVLHDPNLCGYPPDQVTLLHDGKASRQGILDALDVLARQTADADTVLLYYCGHGAYGTDGNYYLTTYDTELSRARVVAGTGVSEGELLDKLRAIPTSRLLLLFNACHAGELSPHLGTDQQGGSFQSISLSPESTEAILSAGEGRIIITACRPNQKSWVGSGKLTIFTQALVDSLSGKGFVPNNAGYVSAFALYEDVYLSVKDAAGVLGWTQEPELTVLKAVGPFPVSLYRGATALGTFDAQESLPADTAAREVDPARSERRFQQIIETVSYHAEVHGSGAIAQGAGAVAAGERGVAVGGNVQGGIIVTGDNTRLNVPSTEDD
jgi:hypothetical protein